MDKPAERLTREKQFRVRVPIGAIFTRYNITNKVKSTSKTNLLPIEIYRNSLLALEDHFKLNLLTIIF